LPLPGGGGPAPPPPPGGGGGGALAGDWDTADMLGVAGWTGIWGCA